MSPTMPAQGNLENLRKQAKDLLKALKAREATAEARFAAHHPHYAERPMLLADAQLVLARELGHPSWCKLKAALKGQTVGTGHDYSKLDLRGNGHLQDSFSLAVQAAARLLNKELDYETIYCLSGNAFAPAIFTGENCTAWWHVEGAAGDRAIDLVAGALGLRVADPAFPADGASPEDPEDVMNEKFRAAAAKRAPILRKSLEDGLVVITSGGWRVRTARGFVPWCWWGILTGIDDDGTTLGACLQAEPGKDAGLRDHPLDYLGKCWIISLAESTISQHAADSAMLRLASARIRGTAPFQPSGGIFYGLAAMDLWIEQMQKVPFCEACAPAGPEGMAGCAVNNVQTANAGAVAAASYLRKRKSAFPATAQGHIEAAASHYDRVVELLRPATWEFYREMLNDSARQKVHAETVLRPMKAEFSATADAIEKALKVVPD